MEGLHGFEVLTCNTLPSLVGTGGEQFRAILFMCWSPPIQISAVYCTSSSHSHHTVHFLTNLILAPRSCVCVLIKRSPWLPLNAAHCSGQSLRIG